MNVYENVAFGLRAANRTDGLDKRFVMPCTRFVWMTSPTGSRTSFPADSSNAWPLHAPLSFSHPASCSMNRFLRWMHCFGEEMRIELRNLITNLGITGIFVTHDQI